MKKWSERSREIAYLLNPAFCGRLLYSAIRAYNLEAKRALPFPLVYLILPLVLHKNTRQTINSKTQLMIWIQRNEHLLINYAKRAKQLVPITNEAVELLLISDYLSLTETAELEVSAVKKALSKTLYIDEEIQECIIKCEHIGKWFARTGKAETIYVSLGVRP